MPVHNADIAAMFGEIADLLDIQGENPFRIRAYRNAARTALDLGRELREMVAAGDDLTSISGIGKDLSEKIREAVTTGTMQALEKLRKQLPPGITDLLQIPGLGPKRVKALLTELKIDSLEKLEKAAKEGKIQGIEGFGEKTEHQILGAVQAKTEEGKRFLRASTAEYAAALVEYLRAAPGVGRVEVAGSFRRAKETVGDLDILVVAKPAGPVMERFVAYDEVKQVLAQGETKSSVLLRFGIQVDLRVVEPKSFGAALHYFTGSKAHNIAIRKLGQDRGLKVNEYGVFKDEMYMAGRTENDVYKAVGLPFIPPELREDSGEILAAQGGELPRLVELGNIRGDLHAHTTESDGKDTLRGMAEAAQARGYEYLGITEHSRRLAMVGGLDEARLLKQIDEIDALNAGFKEFVLLKGIEVDILETGELDLPDAVLSRLDFVIGSIHSHFKFPLEKQTDRVLRAMDHPHFTMLGHPSGRLLLEREPYELDMPRVIRHARERGCFLELNAHPLRLDLNDVYCRMAKDEGVLIGIDTDAHSTMDLEFMRYGVGQARRGWLEKKDVLNTRPLKALRKLLAKTMG